MVKTYFTFTKDGNGRRVTISNEEDYDIRLRGSTILSPAVNTVISRLQLSRVVGDPGVFRLTALLEEELKGFINKRNDWIIKDGT